MLVFESCGEFAHVIKHLDGMGCACAFFSKRNLGSNAYVKFHSG